MPLCFIRCFGACSEQDQDKDVKKVLNIYKPGIVASRDMIPVTKETNFDCKDTCPEHFARWKKKFPAWLISWLALSLLSAVFRE